jgi:hypothetical protein
MTKLKPLVFKKPDWSHWSRIQELTLAEAILLTQGVCPNSHSMEANQGLGEEIDNNKWQLSEICRNHFFLPETSWVKHKGPFLFNAYEVVISLPKFASWVCNEIKFEKLAEEFKLLSIPNEGLKNGAGSEPVYMASEDWKSKAFDLAIEYLTNDPRLSLAQVSDLVASTFSEKNIFSSHGKREISSSTISRDVLSKDAWFSTFVRKLPK